VFKPAIKELVPFTKVLFLNKKPVPVTFTLIGSKVKLSFPFCRPMINEIKASFDGARWNPEPDKCWTIKDCPHNWFQIAFLSGENPYARFDSEYIDWKPDPRIVKGKIVYPYEHQVELTRFILSRHYCVGAFEMGTGKTLSMIYAIEESGFDDWTWVGPRSALKSVELEFKRWGAKVMPRFITYNALKPLLEKWEPGRKAPRGLVLDESQKVKNSTAIRTQAAMHLADAIRNDWGWDGFVVLLSGSPAPKSPVDWFAQCRIAMPGYLKERDHFRFRDRLAVMSEQQNGMGQAFQKIDTWRDSEEKCAKCGKEAEHYIHTFECIAESDDGHAFEKGANEVAKLSGRMQGLVLVKKKAECLDLPDKQYRIIECPPSKSTLRAAQMIANRSTSAAKALILLRELSDGFQYTEEKTGEELCPVCTGSRVSLQHVYTGPEKTWQFLATLYPEDVLSVYSDPEEVILDPVRHPDLYREVPSACVCCNGRGQIDTYSRSWDRVDCPKDDALNGLLEEYEDVGRLVIYAGFEASIERCVELVAKAGWDWMKFDGKGVKSSLAGNVNGWLEHFQGGEGKMAFIGQPGAAGTGLTLTASPAIVYYSNDFNGDSRIQSEDRIHRIGMDANRGATIIDLFHLPTDKYVLENLKLKRKLQDISLGVVQEYLKNAA
jgi:hypothetical protein